MNKTKKINDELPEGSRLPTLEPHLLLDMCTLSSDRNISHISTYVHLPVVKIEYLKLYQFTPLPKLEDKQIKILNEPENFYFYNNSRINVLSNNYLRNCHGYGNYSLCGVLAPEDIEVPNAFVKSIIAGNEDKSCSYINLNFHNYMVFLSSNKIFYSIVYPISIRVDCNNKTTIYNLTESRGVDYSNQCEIHRVINKIQYDMNSLTTYEIDELCTVRILRFMTPKTTIGRATSI